MGDDQVHLGTNQFGRQSGEPLVAPVGPAVLDVDGGALDITKVAQAQAKCLEPRGKRRWGRHSKESDPRHFARLQGARRERPSGCRAAEQRYECAPLHSISSSAATSSLSGTVMPSILAVSALIISSNLLACTTGRSAGLVPLRMRPVWPPACRHSSAMLAP